MLNDLKRNYESMMQSLKTARERAQASPILLMQYRLVTTLIKKYVHGKVIDLGCGDMPFRGDVISLASTYDSLDVSAKHEDITYVEDIQNMSSLEDSTYDSALCLEVIEHVPRPWDALREINRILKGNGLLILSAPHLSRLHEIPHDYYRFTRYGFEKLLTSNGFVIQEIHERGGLFAFLGHQISLAALLFFWKVPWFRALSLKFSYLFSRLCLWLDKALKTYVLFPSGYVIVAQKIHSQQ